MQIDGRVGDLVEQLTFYTNQGRTLGPYGGDGGGPFTIDNCEPRGIFGYPKMGMNWLRSASIVLRLCNTSTDFCKLNTHVYILCTYLQFCLLQRGNFCSIYFSNTSQKKVQFCC